MTFQQKAAGWVSIAIATLVTAILKGRQDERYAQRTRPPTNWYNLVLVVLFSLFVGLFMVPQKLKKR